jgi:hypothetical protein
MYFVKWLQLLPLKPAGDETNMHLWFTICSPHTILNLMKTRGLFYLHKEEKVKVKGDQECQN